MLQAIVLACRVRVKQQPMFVLPWVDRRLCEQTDPPRAARTPSPITDPGQRGCTKILQVTISRPLTQPPGLQQLMVPDLWALMGMNRW